MYDAKKIIIGLVIFLGLVTFPVWYGAINGQASSPPELEIVTDAEQCVESTEYMRSNHMELLTQWQQSVVREGERTYNANDGQRYDISLTGTCLDCHSNKDTFCDRCHDYTGVAPYCWECHIIPEEK